MDCQKSIIINKYMYTYVWFVVNYLAYTITKMAHEYNDNNSFRELCWEMCAVLMQQYPSTVVRSPLSLAAMSSDRRVSWQRKNDYMEFSPLARHRRSPARYQRDPVTADPHTTRVAALSYCPCCQFENISNKWVWRRWRRRRRRDFVMMSNLYHYIDSLGGGGGRGQWVNIRL